MKQSHSSPKPKRQADTLLPAAILRDANETIERAKNALKTFEGKTILITGAAGFLPSNIVHCLAYANTRLLKRPVRVICLDNFLSGRSENLKPWRNDPNVLFFKRDVTKKIDIKYKVDYIIHAASIASPPLYRKFPLETIDANVTGTRQLLELARRDNVSGFMYFSTSEIYGDPQPEYIPTSEDYRGYVSSTGPRACYDESKRLAETLCMVYFTQFRIPVKIIRPFNIYGPGLRLDDGRVIPDFARDVLQNKPITLLSDGRATRSFCYVTDAVSAILMLLAGGPVGEVFNVGNDQEISMRELAETMNKVAGNGSGINYAVSPDKAYLTDNPQRRVPNISKITHTINWKPAVSLQTGLERTLEYFKERNIP